MEAATAAPAAVAVEIPAVAMGVTVETATFILRMEAATAAPGAVAEGAGAAVTEAAVGGNAALLAGAGQRVDHAVGQRQILLPLLVGQRFKGIGQGRVLAQLSGLRAAAVAQVQPHLTAIVGIRAALDQPAVFQLGQQLADGAGPHVQRLHQRPLGDALLRGDGPQRPVLGVAAALGASAAAQRVHQIHHGEEPFAQFLVQIHGNPPGDLFGTV